MKSIFASAIAFAFFSACAFGAANPHYNFNIAVTTGQTIGGYQMAGFGSPAINNLGDVVFSATAKAPIGNSTFPAGLFSLERRLAGTNGYCLGPYIVNDSGQVAFVDDGKISPTLSFVSGVYETTLAGGAVQTILAPATVVNGVQLVGNICATTNVFAFNDAGRIAFADTGGLYTFIPGTGLSKVNITRVDGYTVTPTLLVDGKADDLVFIGNSSSFQGIFTPERLLLRTGEHIDGIELTGILPAVVSKDTRLAVQGSFGPPSANEYAIFTEHSVVAETGTHIGSKVISFVGYPAVNDRGEVIFTGLFDRGLPYDLAIFSRDAEIIAVGDSIGGHTISSLSAPALNDSGVVAFQASFSDGNQAIVLATPQ